jgi:phosphoglucomutase
MNIYTVGRAAQGLALFLKKYFAFPKAVIAYDNRDGARDYAERAAQVLCANGITVFLYNGACPAFMLSFAVRYKNAAAGLAVTASKGPEGGAV